MEISIKLLLTFFPTSSSREKLMIPLRVIMVGETEKGVSGLRESLNAPRG